MEGFAEFRLPATASAAAVAASRAGAGGAPAGVGAAPRAVEEYAWERAYERPWEALTEDESGMLRADALNVGRAALR
jgi:hypothetical protein